jgi:hypothetical protein
VIASDTAAVREFANAGLKMWLCDFFDAEAIATAVLDCLSDLRGARAEAAASRGSVHHFDCNAASKRYEEIALGRN